MFLILLWNKRTTISKRLVKIGKAKKTVPIATQSQNTQSAQSRSVEGWQGKKAPAQATRIFYYNNGNEKVYTHKEYYEYDAMAMSH